MGDVRSIEFVLVITSANYCIDTDNNIDWTVKGIVSGVELLQQ